MRVLLRLATFPHVVGRFHALRKLIAAPTGDVIPFTLMAQNRTAESHQLYTLMHRLARNSVWHLIGSTMRPTKIGRSPLAKQLDKINDPEPLDQARLTVTKLRLANPSNHCYANSVILAVAWGHAGSPQSFQPSLPLGRMLRWLVRHAPLPQTDHARNTVDLWALRVWRQIVHTWQAPHSQHDAGEFVQFLASHLHVDHARYEWQAREEAPSGQVIVRDRGCFWPLILSLPLQTDGPSQSVPSSHVAGISVQRLVIQWRNQPARHAACDLPPWLPLQVSRFNAAHEKITTPVHFSPAIYLPVFTGTGLQTTSIRYALHSVIFHIGRSKFSGHYRTALCQSGQLRFLTDDGVEAIQASEYDRRSVEENAYILLFIRC